jgi:hypothetical protein
LDGVLASSDESVGDAGSVRGEGRLSGFDVGASATVTDREDLRCKRFLSEDVRLFLAAALNKSERQPHFDEETKKEKERAVVE